MRFDAAAIGNNSILMAVLLGLLAFSAPPRLVSADNKPPEKPAQSLDDELLEDLQDETGSSPTTSRQRPANIGAQPKSKQGPAENKPANELDDQLLEDLKLDEPTLDGQDPLSRIGQKMRRAQSLIGDRRPGGQVSELQQEIVRDLDRVMAEARKNSQKSQSKSSSSQASRRDRLDQPQAKPSSAGGRGQASNNPARDSDASMQSRRAEKPDVQTTRNLIQELWGHLPERDRQQVIQPTVETFLPKYELLITEYFKRLAEGARERRAP